MGVNQRTNRARAMLLREYLLLLVVGIPVLFYVVSALRRGDELGFIWLCAIAVGVFVLKFRDAVRTAGPNMDERRDGAVGDPVEGETSSEAIEDPQDSEYCDEDQFDEDEDGSSGGSDESPGVRKPI